MTRNQPVGRDATLLGLMVLSTLHSSLSGTLLMPVVVCTNTAPAAVSWLWWQELPPRWNKLVNLAGKPSGFLSFKLVWVCVNMYECMWSVTCTVPGSKASIDWDHTLGSRCNLSPSHFGLLPNMFNQLLLFASKANSLTIACLWDLCVFWEQRPSHSTRPVAGATAL